MDKYAAEKIAQEYYNLGLELALEGTGRTKVANRQKLKLLQKVLGGTINAGQTFGSGVIGAGVGHTLGAPMLRGLGVDPATSELVSLLAGVGSGIKLAPRVKTPEMYMRHTGLIDLLKGKPQRWTPSFK